jgi:hypothetical protein
MVESMHAGDDLIVGPEDSLGAILEVCLTRSMVNNHFDTTQAFASN